MRILCFGDSNTYGYDPAVFSGGRYPAKHRWTDLLAANTGWAVRNRGENGREIPRHPKAIDQAVRMLKANASTDLTIVMLGTNDLLQGADVSETAARMEVFLQAALPCCRRILLLAPPPLCRGEWVTDEGLMAASAHLAEAYRALAARLDIDFADPGQWNVEIAFDGVHFTEAGNRAFAEGLRAHILTALV